MKIYEINIIYNIILYNIKNNIYYEINIILLFF